MHGFSSFLKYLVQSCMLDRQMCMETDSGPQQEVRTVQLRSGLSLQVVNCVTKQMHRGAMAYQAE